MTARARKPVDEVAERIPPGFDLSEPGVAPAIAAATRRPDLWTRRHYLIAQAVLRTGCHYMLAVEAVASTAIEHPEWNMDEQKTWAEWEKPA